MIQVNIVGTVADSFCFPYIINFNSQTSDLMKIFQIRYILNARLQILKPILCL